MRRVSWRWRLHLEVEHLARTQNPAETDCYHQRHLYQPALAQIQCYSIPSAQTVRWSRFSRSCCRKTLSGSVQSEGCHACPCCRIGVEKHQPRYRAVCRPTCFPSKKQLVKKERSARSMSSSSPQQRTSPEWALHAEPLHFSQVLLQVVRRESCADFVDALANSLSSLSRGVERAPGVGRQGSLVLAAVLVICVLSREVQDRFHLARQVRKSLSS